MDKIDAYDYKFIVSQFCVLMERFAKSPSLKRKLAKNEAVIKIHREYLRSFPSDDSPVENLTSMLLFGMWLTDHAKEVFDALNDLLNAETKGRLHESLYRDLYRFFSQCHSRAGAEPDDFPSMVETASRELSFHAGMYADMAWEAELKRLERLCRKMTGRRTKMSVMSVIKRERDRGYIAGHGQLRIMFDLCERIESGDFP